MGPYPTNTVLNNFYGYTLSLMQCEWSRKLFLGVIHKDMKLRDKFQTFAYFYLAMLVVVGILCGELITSYGLINTGGGGQPEKRQYPIHSQN